MYDEEHRRVLSLEDRCESLAGAGRALEQCQVALKETQEKLQEKEHALENLTVDKAYLSEVRSFHVVVGLSGLSGVRTGLSG